MTVVARLLGKEEVPGQYRGEAPARLAELVYAARLERAAGRHGSSSLLPGTFVSVMVSAGIPESRRRRLDAAPGHEQKLFTSPHRLVVKTADSQSADASSILAGGANRA